MFKFPVHFGRLNFQYDFIMNLCALLRQQILNYFFCHYRLSFGIFHTYWATILTSVQKDQNIKHTLLSLYLPLVIMTYVIFRSCFVLLYLEDLNLEQRHIFFNEQVPPEIRGDLEVLILSWSVFYMCLMFLDYTRTVNQMKHFLILVVEPKPKSDWFLFIRFRKLVILQSSMIIASTATVATIVCIIQTYIRGVLESCPWISAFYFYLVFMWASIACYRKLQFKLISLPNIIYQIFFFSNLPNDECSFIVEC